MLANSNLYYRLHINPRRSLLLSPGSAPNLIASVLTAVLRLIGMPCELSSNQDYPLIRQSFTPARYPSCRPPQLLLLRLSNRKNSKSIHVQHIQMPLVQSAFAPLTLPGAPRLARKWFNGCVCMLPMSAASQQKGLGVKVHCRNISSHGSITTSYEVLFAFYDARGHLSYYS
jgi:hypothetical protein